MKYTYLIEKGLESMVMVFSTIGFKPEEHFTYDAIKDLEEVVNKIFPQGHEPKLTTIVPFGIYLGKTMIEMVEGARWKGLDGDHLFDIYVDIKQKNGVIMKIYPFRMVIHFWEDRGYSLASVIKMCEFVTIYDMSDKKVLEEFEDENGWIHFGTGECFKSNTEKPYNLVDNKG